MDEMEQEINRIDQGGEAWEDTDSPIDLEVSQNLDAVVPVRLTTETYIDLRREARDLGVRPSTLIRMWILEKLRASAHARRSA